LPKQSVRTVLALALLWSVLSPAPSPAQPAWRVADVRTGPGRVVTPFGAEFATAGGLVFFTLDDEIHGRELWKSDGTEAGTALVKDICPGICSAAPRDLVVAGGRVYFSTDGHGYWVSDGTAAGTIRFLETAEPEGFEDLDLAELGGKIFLVGFHDDAGLWETDGTVAGTVLVKSFEATSNAPEFIGRAGGMLFFAASQSSTGRELWRTDGTAAGTQLVKDILPGAVSALDSAPAWYPEVSGRLLFQAFSENRDARLWISDGTTAGTQVVKDIIGQTEGLVEMGGEAFFRLGEQIWKTDGTQAGTVELLGGDFTAGGPANMTVAGTRVFFRRSDSASGSEVWKTDGTVAGTVRVTEIAPGAESGIEHPSTFIALGDRLLFFANDDTTGEEPWVTDGSVPGTFRLGDLNPGTPGSFNFTGERKDRGVIAGGRWYFGAYTHPDGWALWSSDGTVAGTQVVRRFPEPVSSVRDEPFADLGGSLFFPVSYSTLALWSTDGTEAGTSEVKHLGGYPSQRRQLVSQGDHVFYLDRDLYVSDGTAAGTGVLTSLIVLDLVAAETGLFYKTWRPGGALNGVDGDLWVTTDGTSAGIQHLLELEWTGSDAMIPFRNGIAFNTSDLWLSDGTAAGTTPLGLSDSLILGDGLTAAGDRLFFWADADLTGVEPYVSDGTLAGTRLLRDIHPGWQASQEIHPLEPKPSTALGGRWFFTADDGISGEELWISDGTTFGTRRVRDISPGPASSQIAQLTTGLGRVYFTADDGIHGEELWVSDGTEAGTRMVRDIVPGQGTSAPQELAAFGHVVLFAAFDPDHGVELWRTDGTEAGTVRLQDIAPGTAPSSPHRFTASGPNVYFAANDGATGFEPWAISRASLGSALAAAKTATGEHAPGGTVFYTIVISNVGAGPHPDNPGDELVDVLPAGLTLVGATADIGSVSLDLPTRRVAWNGALATGGSATLTIEATVDALPGAVLRNQADLSFDADGDGTNESSSVSDAPGSAGASDPTDIVVSSGPTDFYTVSPCRAVDTRSSSPLLAGTPRTFTIEGLCGVPADASAVAVNLTVFAPTALGNVVAWPAGAPAPGTSNLNFLAGVNRANNAILELSGGEIQALARMVAGGEVHLILDVVGYFDE
jgi:uncharacterized repeat protein (TIGR01451 family)